MTDLRPCVLGCGTGEMPPFQAAPGWMCCHRCNERLMQTLGDLADRYATLQEADELIPHGGSERGSPGFGPRSPAVDVLLAHSDVRTRWTSELGYGALAVVESWARMLREELGAAAPVGRATFSREVATIRFHWDHLLRAAWLDEFAREVQEVTRSLTYAGRLTERVMRIGPCPATFEVEHAETHETYDIPCGAMLRVRADATEIKCRNCGALWPRSRWDEIGDRWADYATLAEDFAVAVGTLWRWASEDGWRKEKRQGRLLVHRDDAEASRDRRATRCSDRPVCA